MSHRTMEEDIVVSTMVSTLDHRRQHGDQRTDECRRLRREDNTSDFSVQFFN